jgi:hypothetical protein
VLVGSGTISRPPHALTAARSSRLRAHWALLDGLRIRSLEQSSVIDSIDEVLIADADFPEEEAVELVDRRHQQASAWRVVWSTMEILMKRVEACRGRHCRCSLKPPLRVWTSPQADLRPVGATLWWRAVAGDDQCAAISSPRARSSTAPAPWYRRAGLPA